MLLYPTRAFSACLTKCKLNGRPGVALKIFVDKFYGCYKDKLDCGYDMRFVSALYFFLRPLVIIIYEFCTLPVSIASNMWFFATTLFASVSILVGFVKPYKKTYMNVLDTLLLAHLALLCLIMSTPFKSSLLLALSKLILLLVPLIVFLVAHLICKLKSFTLFKKSSSFICCLRKAKIYTLKCSILVNHTHGVGEHQNLIPPRVINNDDFVSYGSI